ncbi:hypothetical protein AB0N73_04070 [Microbacterium sp. NPDC089189]|uniref:hypothetical protein n=1 Tax=Microbacterium sp. NPDC089189 TaxID=3154972 RepID=UPI003425D5DC
MSYLPDEPVLVITAGEARMLWQAARLDALRVKHRSGNTALYDVLVKFYRVGLLEIAERGTQTRQSAASEERERWTTQQVARAAGIAERTVRLDCKEGTLPATQHRSGGPWAIDADAATTYIRRRKKH